MSWSIKKAECWNWCFWTVVLEKTLESPLDSKEIKPVHPKGSQPWIFIERTDTEAEAPILWPPDWKSRLIGKDPDAGNEWNKRRRGWQRIRCLNSISNAMDMSLSKLWEIVRNREAWCAIVHRVTKSQTRFRDWTTTKYKINTQHKHYDFSLRGNYSIEDLAVKENSISYKSPVTVLTFIKSTNGS